MKKIFLYCLDKWWIALLFSAILLVLAFFFDNGWLFFLGFLSIISVVISLFVVKTDKEKIGCLIMFSLFVYLFLSFNWYVSGPDYSKYFKNRKKNQNIIGVNIPKFKVIDSSHHYHRNSEYGGSTIEFKLPLDDSFFNVLDSICALPIPQNLEEKSTFFYSSSGIIHRCWSKEEHGYTYLRKSDIEVSFPNINRTLNIKDGVFEFIIIKDSRIGSIFYWIY